MVEDSRLHLTPGQKAHEEIMRAIASKMEDTPYVLKGGTALLLTRGLDRHSTDLDFDSPKALNLENRIREGVEAAGGRITSLTLAKDTDTVQRFKVNYDHSDASDTTNLKIETSFRNPPDAADIEVVEGIKTYRVESLIDQKLEAAENRDKARDLYDLAWLVKNHGSQFSDRQLERLDEYSKDIDSLAARMEIPFRDDPAMPGVNDASDAVLSLRENLETQHMARIDKMIEERREGVLETIKTISNVHARVDMEMRMGEVFDRQGPQLERESPGLYQNVAERGYTSLASTFGGEMGQRASHALAEISEEGRSLGLNPKLLHARYAAAGAETLHTGTESLWRHDDMESLAKAGISVERAGPALEEFHRKAAGVVTKALEAISVIREHSRDAGRDIHSI